MNSRSFVLSAVIAGMVIGLLANLPLFNLINCILCLFVWVGGLLAVFLYGRFQHGGPGLTAAQGAGLGALAGLIGAFVGIFVNGLTSFISVPVFADFARFLKIEGSFPLSAGDLPSIIKSTFFFFILDALFYPLFGAISGFIGASLTGKGPQPKSGGAS